MIWRISGISDRNPVKMTLSAIPQSETNFSRQLRHSPSPIIRSLTFGKDLTTMLTASIKYLIPFCSDRRTPTPITLSSLSIPSSSRFFFRSILTRNFEASIPLYITWIFPGLMCSYLTRSDFTPSETATIRLTNQDSTISLTISFLATGKTPRAWSVWIFTGTLAKIAPIVP